MKIIDFSKDTEKAINIIKKDPYMDFNVRSLINRLVELNNYLIIKIKTDKNLSFIHLKNDKILQSDFKELFHPMTIDSYYNLNLDKNERAFLIYYSDLIYNIYDNLL